MPQAGNSGLLQAEGSSAHDLGPSTSYNNDDMLSEDQGQLTGQDGDSNDQDDQVIPPRCNEDIEARRRARVERTLAGHDHLLEKVIGDVRSKVSTRRQLANFSDHQAHIAMFEPKKVAEAQIGRASCRERVYVLV